MKISLVLGVLFAALVPTYAARAAATSPAPVVAKAPIVTWKDSEQKVLFTSDDILFFDWDDQYFLLKEAAFKNYVDWVNERTLSHEMTVEDKDGLIYKARWVSGTSSRAFFQPIYESGAESMIYISRMYPGFPGPLVTDDSPDSKTPRDPRDSKRLRADLQAAGVFKARDESARPATDSSTNTHRWASIGADAHVGVECFGETFGREEQPRADFLFATGAELQKQTDNLAIEIRYVANGGLFRSDTRIEAISPSVMNERVYHCQLPPWKPVEGSQPTITSEAGTVTFSLLFQKRRNGKLVTFQRVEFEPFLLSFGGPARTIPQYAGGGF